MAVPTVRVRRGPRSGGGPASQGVRDRARVSPRCPRRGTRGEFRGSRPAADALEPGRQGLALHWIIFGLDAFRGAIDRSLDLARLAQERIETSDELELITPAYLGVVTFRRRFGGDRDEDTLTLMNAELVEGLVRSGVGLVSSTRLRGRYAIRLVPMNHATDPIGRVSRSSSGWSRRPSPSRRSTLCRRRRYRSASRGSGSRGWPERDRRSDGTSHPAVRIDSPMCKLRRLLRAPGSSASSRDRRSFASGRARADLFVVLDGSAQVFVETRVVRELGPGDVFGEVAALEWGLEFGYARTATVSAISPMRVLVVPRDALQKLLPEAPMLGDELRRLSQHHLAGH